MTESKEDEAVREAREVLRELMGDPYAPPEEESAVVLAYAAAIRASARARIVAWARSTLSSGISRKAMIDAIENGAGA